MARFSSGVMMRAVWVRLERRHGAAPDVPEQRRDPEPPRRCAPGGSEAGFAPRQRQTETHRGCADLRNRRRAAEASAAPAEAAAAEAAAAAVTETKTAAIAEASVEATAAPAEAAVAAVTEAKTAAVAEASAETAATAVAEAAAAAVAEAKTAQLAEYFFFTRSFFLTRISQRFMRIQFILFRCTSADLFFSCPELR
jgi:hypothetical protein